MNKIVIGAQKTIFDPGSEFSKELEIQKHKLEIKPRKVNMMQSQVGMLEDFVAEVSARKLYVPSSNGGFI